MNPKNNPSVASQKVLWGSSCLSRAQGQKFPLHKGNKVHIFMFSMLNAVSVRKLTLFTIIFFLTIEICFSAGSILCSTLGLANKKMFKTL